MKYLIALFYLYPGGQQWDYKVLADMPFKSEVSCELVGQAFDGTLNDGTLIIHNCIEDTNGQGKRTSLEQDCQTPLCRRLRDWQKW